MYSSVYEYTILYSYLLIKNSIRVNCNLNYIVYTLDCLQLHVRTFQYDTMSIPVLLVLKSTIQLINYSYMYSTI